MFQWARVGENGGREVAGVGGWSKRDPHPPQENPDDSPVPCFATTSGSRPCRLGNTRDSVHSPRIVPMLPFPSTLRWASFHELNAVQYSPELLGGYAVEACFGSSKTAYPAPANKLPAIDRQIMNNTKRASGEWGNPDIVVILLMNGLFDYGQKSYINEWFLEKTGGEFPTCVS